MVSISSCVAAHSSPFVTVTVKKYFPSTPFSASGVPAIAAVKLTVVTVAAAPDKSTVSSTVSTYSFAAVASFTELCAIFCGNSPSIAALAAATNSVSVTVAAVIVSVKVNVASFATVPFVAVKITSYTPTERPSAISSFLVLSFHVIFSLPLVLLTFTPVPAIV